MSSQKIVTLDNATTVGLLRNSSILNTFPALKNVAKQLKIRSKGCGRCGRSVAAMKDKIAVNAKKAIAAMSGSQKGALKKMLNADKIRLVTNKKVNEF